MAQNVSRFGFNLQSLLVVCVGNTCRSPMAEALAKRLWPDCRIQSAGTSVANPNDGAASEAIETMKRLGLDISAHTQTSISDVELGEFEFVMALDKGVKSALTENYNVDESRILDVFVGDPFGSDIGQYHKCANAIAKRIRNLKFART